MSTQQDIIAAIFMNIEGSHQEDLIDDWAQQHKKETGQCVHIVIPPDELGDEDDYIEWANAHEVTHVITGFDDHITGFSDTIQRAVNFGEIRYNDVSGEFKVVDNG